MKFKSSIIKESVLDGCDYKEEGIEFIEESGWEDDGKYSNNTYVFKYDGKYYCVYDSKTGSYYTDYYFGSENWGAEIECHEVESYEVIVKKWRRAKI